MLCYTEKLAILSTPSGRGEYYRGRPGAATAAATYAFATSAYGAPSIASTA